MTRDLALDADQLVHERAMKMAVVQRVELEEAVEAAWESIEDGLLRFIYYGDRLALEPCGTTPAERRAARAANRRLLKCRRRIAPAAAFE